MGTDGCGAIVVGGSTLVGGGGSRRARFGRDARCAGGETGPANGTGTGAGFATSGVVVTVASVGIISAARGTNACDSSRCHQPTTITPANAMVAATAIQGRRRAGA